MPEGVDQRRPAASSRPTHRSPGPHRVGCPGARDLGGGPRPRRRPALTAARRGRPRRRGRLRRWWAHQREGVPAGEVREGRPRHGQHRLQRPLLHEQRRSRGQPLPRGRPRAAVPAHRPRRSRCRPAAGQQRRRDHAPVGRPPRRGARPGRPGRRRPTPQRHGGAHRERPGDPPPAGPGHRPGDPAGPAARRPRGGAGGHGIPDRAHHRPRGASPQRRQPGGRNEQSRSAASAPSCCVARRGCWRPPARRAVARARSCSRAEGWSSPPRAPPRSPPRSTWPWPWACPAGWAAVTERSPGRATGRAAASTARSPTSSPATA